MALWLVVAALLLKMLVPAGFMPVLSAGSISMALCSGAGPESLVVTIPRHDDRRHADDRTKPVAASCGFSGHSAGAMAMAGPLLLVAAIAFIIATLSKAITPQAARRARYHRQHPRGPPATR